MKRPPIEIRFWQKVNRDGPTVDPSIGPCWVWEALTVWNGYGFFRDGHRMVYAHRWAWEMINGPITSGLWVLHRCDTRNCVRPSHLFLGTVQDNVDDMVRKGRDKHPTGENHWMSVLSVSDVESIRILGPVMSREEIAARFGISKRHVFRILAHDNWA